MKAMRLHHPAPVDQHPLRFEDVDEPTPDANEIRIHVQVCGVCRTDLHEVEGELPISQSPVIPGHQIVGSVVECGSAAERFRTGDRVGVSWLHDTCGACPFCRSDPTRENLCRDARFTGWSVNGGYAEYAVAPEDFAYRMPDGIGDEQAAPLLCAGVIGYRALRLCRLERGARLGLYGFGSSAHIAIQVARHWDCEVYVFTRSEANRNAARKLGAAWVGGSEDPAPAQMNASIIFAPAGRIVRDALRILDKGGIVALAGIYMSEIPPLDYREDLYDEKVLRSVANATRGDAVELLALAAEIPIVTTTTAFPLQQANEALVALKNGDFTGSAVLRCAR